MITPDTNVLVRLLTQDDPAQYDRAYNLFQDNPIFLPTTIILETEWVLRFAYHFSPSQINQAFQRLFGLPNVTLADPNAISAALRWHADGLDFADALHLASSGPSEAFATFDKKLLSKAGGVVDMPVVTP